ncbi:MAG TPA: alkaline phosphatase family protein [Rhizomicrobium sp.]|jgi:phospholipase C
MALSDIETIVIVMMENRSFDHMLGYLSLDRVMPVEGLKGDAAWQASFANIYAKKTYPLSRTLPGTPPCSDPQHDQKSIAVQINTPAQGQPAMGGFVESFKTYSDPVPADPSAVMDYFDARSVPAFDFLARNYCVCDHWFSSLPLGTQANRLMAMAGESLVLDNASLLLPDQDLVYDWLTRKNIIWRAYQWGDFLPFFSLMPSWLPQIAESLTLSQMGMGGRFRRYTHLETDWNSADAPPQVIFIEPEYTDGPHAEPNDDHAPTGIAPGQAFLADIYRILTGNPGRWAKTMLIVTYDEHGGFFDHVRPLDIPATINGAKISTTGVRVPALIVSPYVKPGSVFTGPLDHTSLLQVLDDRFGKDGGYSDAVNARQKSLDRIGKALTPSPAIAAPPAMPAIGVPARTAAAVPAAPNTANAQALHLAARKLAAEHPQYLKQPGWEKLNRYLAAPAIAPKS